MLGIVSAPYFASIPEVVAVTRYAIKAVGCGSMADRQLPPLCTIARAQSDDEIWKLIACRIADEGVLQLCSVSEISHTVAKTPLQEL